MLDKPFLVGDAKATRETDKAVLFIIEGQEEWIPKSQIHDDSEVWQGGCEGALIVTEWFAEQRGWL